MNTKKLIKPDNSKCVAICKTAKVFVENQSGYFQGQVSFYENNMLLFNHYTKINRLTKDDALADAVDLAIQNGF